MSNVLTDFVTRVVYISGEWLYVILATETDLFGVRFVNNTATNANPRFATVKASDLPDGPINHPLTVVDWWPGMVADFLSRASSAPVSGDQDTDQAYHRGVEDGRREANETFEAWKAKATEVAHEYADNNDLCSEFDRCMREIGLPDRGPKSYRVTFEVQLERGSDPYDVFPSTDDGYIEDWTRTNVETV